MGHGRPHTCVKLSEAIGAPTVPAISFRNFMNEAYELPCANEWTCFPEGGKLSSTSITFLHVPAKDQKAMAENEGCGYSFGDKPSHSLATLRFPGDSCTISGV